MALIKRELIIEEKNKEELFNKITNFFKENNYSIVEDRTPHSMIFTSGSSIGLLVSQFIPMSIRRVIDAAAFVVCNVEKTRCPVIDALKAISAVS